MRTSTGAQRQAGFTLVELLVVIVIIAILAAISIPIFFSQREKGFHAQVVSALRNGATTMQAWATENNGDYAPGAPADNSPGNEANDMAWLKTKEWRAAEEVTVDIVSADSNGFCLEGTHAQVGTLNLQYASGRGIVEDGPCS